MIKTRFHLQKRKKTILDHSTALAKVVNGHAVIQEGLLNEVGRVYSRGDIQWG